MTVPAQPKIYHICHVDRLPSIIASAGLLSDAVLLNQTLPGTVIGMSHIKQRRLHLELDSHPDLQKKAGLSRQH
ncbi:DarT ssDNA thymidine ADP-ribosyltransferase family protein [Pseudomonas kermanshahensis]|uniref:DarT ssDNA thymidine ADP-ribosyltransferase family protein n=1 Tax=Pseudomonas kermanshahensis TaxID=2745482 RepID=UPI0023DC60DD|nr:DarT ssDNA thymidine ADP-ribosyltransferase family protein [Pseudomonas kermanshahensis]WEL54935.1 DarT ssDNA thymidine ADP-ribosyltransferase family protein [Pseudomonas kermanshahensis]